MFYFNPRLCSVSTRFSASAPFLERKKRPFHFFFIFGKHIFLFRNDLLYTILLKQQRKPPVSDFEPGHIETTKIKLLKAGSIDRLVDHLACAPIFRDEKFLSIFLSTYRTFILPYQGAAEKYFVLEGRNRS